MYSTKELYGINPDKFKDKPYTEALQIKIDAGRDYLKVLATQAKDVMSEPDHYYSIVDKYTATEKAIQFNRELQEEIKEQK